jgi:hypothetical protein
MTDRELLERAAKAAGMADIGKYDDDFGFQIDADVPCGYVWWNPLTDDGDALRLAVKMNFYISIEVKNAGAIYVGVDFDWDWSPRHPTKQDAPFGGDDYAATRRAIVRAAAAIGENQ